MGKAWMPKREDYSDDQIWHLASKVLIRNHTEKLRSKAVRWATRAVQIIYPTDYTYHLSRIRYEMLDHLPDQKKAQAHFNSVTRRKALENTRRMHPRTFAVALELYWSALKGYKSLPDDPIAEIKRVAKSRGVL